MSNLKGILSTAGSLTASLSAESSLTASLSSKIFIKTQTKEVTPTAEAQEITADAGYAGLSKVTVSAIPQNYGLITYNGYILVS